MSISKNGVNLIKSHEGFRSRAYDDLQPNKTLSSLEDLKGVLTIGYGHTKNVIVGQVITESVGEKLLISDLQNAINSVIKNVKVPITQNMFDSLVSFVFNVGGSAFANSTLLKMLNDSNYLGSANQFDRWVRSGGNILQGLVNRRNDEKNLFLSGISVLTYNDIAYYSKPFTTQSNSFLYLLIFSILFFI
jgi:lysozyme